MILYSSTWARCATETVASGRLDEVDEVNWVSGEADESDAANEGMTAATTDVTAAVARLVAMAIEGVWCPFSASPSTSSDAR